MALEKNKQTESVEMILDASPGFSAMLSDLARTTGDSEGDILVKSLALMAIAVQAKRQGQTVVVRIDEHHFTEIGGI